ncbi:aspartyl protease UND-like [Humulus lupulus]|uniref:aspartyl protease UND-like n=1 Tax=Humulus lupulus TaxID=3486 RepID=UPI002B418072|nr:aspartyl protease UND-like [Humulus lupulus]
MEISSTSVSFSFFIIFLSITTIFPSMVITSTSVAKPKPLTLNLVHSNLVLSENDDMLFKAKSYNDDFLFNLSPVENGLMFVNLSIGDPPLQQLAVLDTGNARFWLLCFPCQGCHEITSPIFTTSRSKTYTQLPCNDRCRNVTNIKCKSPDSCPFQGGYAVGPIANGVFATEQLTLGTSDEGIRIVSDVLFGCANKNFHDRIRDSRFNGVFGLGYYRDSLAKRLGSKFSYCVGNVNDPNYPYSQLLLGDGIKFEGHPIPMVPGGVYRDSLQSISIGGEKLAIRAHTAVIDTGTLVTRLANGYFTTIKREIQTSLDELGLSEISYYNNNVQLCYSGSIEKDLVGFPVVRLQFANNGALELERHSLFYVGEWGDDSFCLAMTPSIDRDMTIIGLMAQQHYSMGFDIDNERLYVQKIDCEYYRE